MKHLVYFYLACTLLSTLNAQEPTFEAEIPAVTLQEVSQEIQNQTKKQIVEAKKKIELEEKLKKQRLIDEENEKKLIQLNLNLEEIEQELKNNIWLKRYSNYRTYRAIEKELDETQEEYKRLSKSNLNKAKE
ncbi:MAG: hypothetical protein U9N30_05885, partial [Campylobacterota bacterium]|nr:hypothetical protein [Campylobacterota bacterium]